MARASRLGGAPFYCQACRAADPGRLVLAQVRGHGEAYCAQHRPADWPASAARREAERSAAARPKLTEPSKPERGARGPAAGWARQGGLL